MLIKWLNDNTKNIGYIKWEKKCLIKSQLQNKKQNLLTRKN